MEAEPKGTDYSLGAGIAMVLSFVLHGVAAFFFAASGLVAPGPIVLLLLLAWGALLAFLVINRRRALVVVLVPLADAVLWLALVPGLGTILDWKP